MQAEGPAGGFLLRLLAGPELQKKPLEPCSPTPYKGDAMQAEGPVGGLPLMILMALYPCPYR